MSWNTFLPRQLLEVYRHLRVTVTRSSRSSSTTWHTLCPVMQSLTYRYRRHDQRVAVEESRRLGRYVTGEVLQHQLLLLCQLLATGRERRRRPPSSTSGRIRRRFV